MRTLSQASIKQAAGRSSLHAPVASAAERTLSSPTELELAGDRAGLLGSKETAVDTWLRDAVASCRQSQGVRLRPRATVSDGVDGEYEMQCRLSLFSVWQAVRAVVLRETASHQTSGMSS